MDIVYAVLPKLLSTPTNNYMCLKRGMALVLCAVSRDFLQAIQCHILLLANTFKLYSSGYVSLDQYHTWPMTMQLSYKNAMGICHMGLLFCYENLSQPQNYSLHTINALSGMLKGYLTSSCVFDSSCSMVEMWACSCCFSSSACSRVSSFSDSLSVSCSIMCVCWWISSSWWRITFLSIH